MPADSRFQLLARTASRLLISEQPQAFIQEICLEVMNATGCDVFLNYLLDETTGVLQLNSFAGVPSDELPHAKCLRPGVGVCGTVAKSAEPRVVQNIQEHPSPETNLVYRLGVQAYACYPLVAYGNVLGTLSFGTRRRTTFVVEDLELMSAVADMLAGALHRMRSQQVLQQSAEFTRRVLNNLFAFVGVLTPDGILVEANRAPLDAAGLKRTDVIGKPFEDSYWWNYSEESRLRLREAIARAAKGEFLRYDVQVRVAGDHRMTIDFMIAPMRDDAGRITHLIPSAVNVDERCRAEERSRKLEGELRTIVNNLPVGVWYLNAEGRVQFGNPAGQSIWGNAANAAPFGALNAWSHASGKPLAPADWATARALSRGDVTLEEILDIETFDGGRKTVMNSAVPVRGPHSEITGVVVINQDITERVRAEEELRQAHRELQSHLKHTPLGVIEFGPDFRVTRWAGHAEKIFGWTAAEILGKRMDELEWVHPEDREMVRQTSLSLSTGQQVVSRNRNLTKTGQVRHCEWYNSSVVSPEGKLQSIFSLVLDVTEKHAAEEQFKESKHLLQAITDTAPSAIYLFDFEEGRAVFINVQSANLLGVSADELCQLGPHTLRKHLHRADAPRWLAHLRNLQKSPDGVVLDLEYRFRHKDGAWRWFQSRDVCFSRKPDGTIKRVLGIALDITLRKHAEQALLANERELEKQVAQRTAALQETTDQLNSFCYTIAHDLRAPLRAQEAFGNILLEDYGDALGEDGRNYARRIVGAAVRLGDLVRDLLAHASLSRGDITLTPTSVLRAMHHVWTDLGENIAAQNASVEYDDMDVMVMAHAPSLNLILNNLVSNAIKFVPAGKAPHVRLWIEKLPDGFVRINVQDNGIGIATQHQERIFGVFERLHSKDVYPGTGIGLALVRKGCERMGGRVGLQSAEGQGSRFWIDLRQATST